MKEVKQIKVGPSGNVKWYIEENGTMLRKKDGTGRFWKTKEAAERAAK